MQIAGYVVKVRAAWVWWQRPSSQGTQFCMHINECRFLVTNFCHTFCNPP